MALTRRSFIASSAAFAAAGCAAPGVAGTLKEHTCPPFWKTYRDDNDPGVRVFTVRPDGTYATSIFAESDC